jgi:mannitol/fructose-specific phosphotransferase system IIA component (Ntr-type)
MSNKLVKISEFGIIDIVVTLMHTVESFVEMSGEQKKQYVIDQLIILLGETDYQQHEEIISNLIEFLIAMSKNNYDLKLNKITKCCTIA